ncbi:thiol-disulfide oxidoreductase DCC family protein [Hyphococcus luteus]|uniref:thiol-disulfide oxidoreductase DCC family protein n=1 Tax=Hyphococcus luteus TaxID=2058213 RepID=UPI0013FDA9DA|nr:DCC1-like thiol-disulfide oxidoreductase family protein [Marinicaulis flavus]
MADDCIYLFDGHCVLCSRGVRYVLKYERSPELRFVAIQSEEGRRLAEANGVDPERPHTFLYVENGAALQRSDAVFALARKIGGPVRRFLFLRRLPRPVRDFFYDRIARNRYALFGRMKECYLPAPETRARFTLPEIPQRQA